MWYVIATLDGQRGHELIDKIRDDFDEGMREVFELDPGDATEGYVFGPWYESTADIPSAGNYSPQSYEQDGYYVTWDAGYGWLTLYGYDEECGKD